MSVPFLIAVQLVTFVMLGILFMDDGQYRLGIAQLLLAIVQAVIYTGKMA